MPCATIGISRLFDRSFSQAKIKPEMNGLRKAMISIWTARLLSNQKPCNRLNNTVMINAPQPIPPPRMLIFLGINLSKIHGKYPR